MPSQSRRTLSLARCALSTASRRGHGVEENGKLNWRRANGRPSLPRAPARVGTALRFTNYTRARNSRGREPPLKAAPEFLLVAGYVPALSPILTAASSAFATSRGRVHAPGAAVEIRTIPYGNDASRPSLRGEVPSSLLTSFGWCTDTDGPPDGFSAATLSR